MPSKYRNKPPAKKPVGWTPPKPKQAPPPPPKPFDQPWKPPKPKKYTVKKGDNWFNIAQNQLGDQEAAQRIVKVNPDVMSLKPGMVINLPGEGFTIPKAPSKFDMSGLNTAQSLGYDPSLRGRGSDTNEPGNILEQGAYAYKTLQYNLQQRLKPLVEPSNALGQNIRYGAQKGTRGLLNAFNVDQEAYQVTAQPVPLADMVHGLAAEKEAQKSAYGGYNVPPKPVRPGEGPTGAVWGSETGGVSDRPPVSPMTLAMIDQGVSPYRITEAEQNYLGFSDEEMQELGYDYQDGNWIVRPRVSAPPPSAGAYSGSAPYSYRGYGGGRGGGGGGRRVGGASGQGGYRPPPGSFGLVTWRL